MNKKFNPVMPKTTQQIIDEQILFLDSIYSEVDASDRIAVFELVKKALRGWLGGKYNSYLSTYDLEVEDVAAGVYESIRKYIIKNPEPRSRNTIRGMVFNAVKYHVIDTVRSKKRNDRLQENYKEYLEDSGATTEDVHDFERKLTSPLKLVMLKQFYENLSDRQRAVLDGLYDLGDSERDKDYTVLSKLYPNVCFSPMSEEGRAIINKEMQSSNRLQATIQSIKDKGEMYV